MASNKMRRIRQVIMLSALVVMGLLLLLSILGAFVGVQKARAIFNSAPLAVFWLLLCGLLIGGLFAFKAFVAFKRPLRAMGLLAVHVGCVLILVGSMVGSNTGQALMAKLSGDKRVTFGYMKIFEGHMTNSVRDAAGKELGKLPFSVGLRDFRIEYYEAPGPCVLGINAPPAAAGGERRRQEITWAVGQETDIPFVNVRLKVLQYLDSARPVYAEQADSRLEITEADGKRTVLPAEVGAEASLKAPPVELRVLRAFSNLYVKHGKAEDVKGRRENPALEIEFLTPDGKRTTGLAFASMARMYGFGKGKKELALRMLPGPTAEADAGSNLPAMQVLLTHEGKELREWLLVKDARAPVSLALTPLLGSGEANDDGDDLHGHSGSTAFLHMAKRQGMIRDYKSELAVYEERRKVAEKTIEVNDPLYYGGYHFYQSSCDAEHGRYTVLSVKSDTGLGTVYAGFWMLCVGVFVLFWFRPAPGPLTKRSDHGD